MFVLERMYWFYDNGIRFGGGGVKIKGKYGLSWLE